MGGNIKLGEVNGSGGVVAGEDCAGRGRVADEKENCADGENDGRAVDDGSEDGGAGGVSGDRGEFVGRGEKDTARREVGPCYFSRD
jgi:hypothetical protein